MTVSLGELRSKRLLVTGGLGFLGRWVTALASEHGAIVSILDRNPSPASLPDAARVVTGDLLTLPDLDEEVQQCDYVVHLAGSLGTESTFSALAETMESNVVGTARIIEACLRSHRRAVYLMVGNDWLNPYTISRRCASDLGIMANLECDGDFRILKTMNAYGPWQAYGGTRKIVPTFIRSCLLDEPIEIFGDGNQCIDLIYARDVAEAILLSCVCDNLPLDRYLEVGAGIPYRVAEVADAIKAMTGSDSELCFAGKRKGEPMHSVTLARDDSLKIQTGFSPSTPLTEGLRQTLDWYLKHPGYLGLSNEDAAIARRICQSGSDLASCG